MSEHADFKKAAGYVGRPYVDGSYDCGHFFVDVQHELFGRAIDVPAVHSRGRRHQEVQINQVKNSEFVPLDAPEHGCAVLMVSADVWHIGTAIICDGVCWVLHNSRAMGGVALQKTRDLRGQRIEGFYKYVNAR